ncbi:hypothetical protein ACQKIE_14545 [Luteibacter sp. NPDC031894]|uniref:hypothetical protein n=1 Tax=Luteibacter sp. NPDC031894 TaxID=3390572 RepID=UPI003D04D742
MRNPTRTLLATFVTLALGIGAVNAQTALAGLGQAWPNATDVSRSPNFHVYVFQRGNTRYIQVNDGNGNVRGAFQRTPYVLGGLPIGVDAEHLATPDEPLPAPASTAGETVYKDDSVQLFVAPQPDGTMRMMLVPAECKNPVECTTRGN